MKSLLIVTILCLGTVQAMANPLCHAKAPTQTLWQTVASSNKPIVVAECTSGERACCCGLTWVQEHCACE